MGSKDLLGLFQKWAGRYGDIFYYRGLHRDLYFLNHPDLVKEVLLTNPQNFIKGETLRNNRRIFGNGLLTSEGEAWRKQRRLKTFKCQDDVQPTEGAGKRVLHLAG